MKNETGTTLHRDMARLSGIQIMEDEIGGVGGMVVDGAVSLGVRVTTNAYRSIIMTFLNRPVDLVS